MLHAPLSWSPYTDAIPSRVPTLSWIRTDHFLGMLQLCFPVVWLWSWARSSNSTKLKKVVKAKRRESWKMERRKDDVTATTYLNQSDINIEDATPDDIRDISSRWSILQEIVIWTAWETLGNSERKNNKKPWITAEMIVKMEEWRKWESGNTEESQRLYKMLNNQLRRQTVKGRQKWREAQFQIPFRLVARVKVDRFSIECAFLSFRDTKLKFSTCILILYNTSVSTRLWIISVILYAYDFTHNSHLPFI